MASRAGHQSQRHCAAGWLNTVSEVIHNLRARGEPVTQVDGEGLRSEHRIGGASGSDVTQPRVSETPSAWRGEGRESCCEAAGRQRQVAERDREGGHAVRQRSVTGLVRCALLLCAVTRMNERTAGFRPTLRSNHSQGSSDPSAAARPRIQCLQPFPHSRGPSPRLPV